MFYVYQNWRARGLRARMHKGYCKLCNDGLAEPGDLIQRTLNSMSI